MGWTFFSPREKLQSLQSGVGIQHTDTKVFWTWHSLTFGQGNINIEDCPLSIVKSKPSIIVRIFIYLRGPSGQLRLKCSSDTSGVQLTGHFIDTAPSPPSQQENLVKFKYFPNSIVQKRLDIMENNKTTRDLDVGRLSEAFLWHHAEWIECSRLNLNKFLPPLTRTGGKFLIFVISLLLLTRPQVVQ